MTSAPGAQVQGAPRCGCCGQVRQHLAELGDTPGVYMCRRCALWAVRRASRPTPPAAGDINVIAIRQPLHDEIDGAYATFHALLLNASPDDLHRRSAGTRWTNQQLLFHMVFGYLIVLRLLPLVHLFGQLPDSASRRFAAILNATTRPFHTVNYLGSWAGGTVLSPAQIETLLERTITHLHRRLKAESPEALDRKMHFPVGWDPFFNDVMTLADVYHFGTQHFDYHHKQLTLDTGI